MRVVLVSCAATKAATARPAGELYTSQLFGKARAVAEQDGDRWGILSALHGLLWPDQVTVPYEHRVHDMSRRERRRWAQRIAQQLGEAPGGGVVELLAGRTYAEPLVPALELAGWRVEQPLAGLGIGQQLHHLKKRIR